MALIVEDGTGVAGAESYVTVAVATAYHAARGNADWAALASDTIREQALRKATDFMLQEYRESWKGRRVNEEQALDWPRYEVERTSQVGFVSSSIVPTEVKNACCELALRAATEDLNPDLTQQVLSESVGPISTSYDPHSPQQKRFRAVAMMLRVLLRGNSLCVKVGRS